jgi:hypothetical protein
VTELVSIVTPTFPARQELLLSRCIPSVQKLDWPNVEHVIVSDPNPELREIFAHNPWPAIRFVEINDSWRDGVQDKSVGAVPWHIGTMMALGEFVGFLGDDDEYLPHHVHRHVEAMKTQFAMFSISISRFFVRGDPVFCIGDDTFAHGHLDSTGMMCHKDALRYANWVANGEDAADYRLVRDWQRAGLSGTFVPEITVNHHDGWAG